MLERANTPPILLSNSSPRVFADVERNRTALDGAEGGA